jgi:hypothetical protein
MEEANPTRRRRKGPPVTIFEGEQYGRLTVIREFDGPRGASRERLFTCECECGTRLEVRSGSLRSGNTKSCGCLKRQRAAENGAASSRTHGMEGTPTYRSWQAMRGRCENPNATGYERYGGRGIVPCALMRTFEGFLATLGVRPANTSVDRINPEGGYWCGSCNECVDLGRPGNVRWADRLTQRHNRRARV